MTSYEILGVVAGFLAVVIAALALFNSRRTNNRLEKIASEQLAIQRTLAKKELRTAAVQDEARQRAEVTAEFRRMGAKSMHRIVLKNAGAASAHNVNIEFVLEGRDESPIMDEEKLPLEQLDAGTEYSLQAIISSAWAPPADVIVTWDDPDGTSRSRNVRIDG